jgi:anti-anti-sigma factor
MTSRWPLATRDSYEVAWTPIGDHSVLVLDGELDIASAQHLDTQLRRLQQAGPVAVDLHGLDFLDSTGAAALIAAHQRAAGPGAFVVLNGSGPAHRALTIMGLDAVVPMAGAPGPPRREAAD